MGPNRRQCTLSLGLEHTEAFYTTKQEIQHAPLLAYYDPRIPTVLQMGMSGYRIGSCLLQNGKPVAYASKVLQPHEQGYIALEHEALAVV